LLGECSDADRPQVARCLQRLDDLECKHINAAPVPKSLTTRIAELVHKHVVAIVDPIARHFGSEIADLRRELAELKETRPSTLS
jgi:hypothetical protein